MKAHNNGQKPRFSPEEKQAQMQVAQQLGYSDPRELGDAMKQNQDLKEKVGGLMKELGFERGPKGPPPHGGKHGGPPPGGGRGGPPPQGGAEGAQATGTTDADTYLEQLARDNGFIDSSQKGDINSLIQAVKSGAIKDPQIVAAVGDAAGVEPNTGINSNQANQLGVSPSPNGDQIDLKIT